MSEAASSVAEACALVSQASRITVLTGAGVSTASGIPDFRGPNGVWTQNPGAARMFDIDTYLAEREVRVQAWRNRRDHPAWLAQPNAAHAALVGIERDGRLRALLTQNIDELHQAAGSGEHAPLLELHGSVRRAMCLECGWRGPMQDVLARVEAGEEDPPCLVCGGILKSDTISFGQSLDAEVLRAAAAAATDCDLFLAVGTSLQVNPAAGLVPLAVRAGADLVIVNAEPTPFDLLADAVVSDPIEEALPAILAGIAGTPR